MEFSSEFIPLKLDEVPALSDRMKSEHARFVQILAVNTDAGVDLVYSFMMDGGALCNYEVKGVKKTDVVPSITGNFLCSFRVRERDPRPVRRHDRGNCHRLRRQVLPACPV